jgi:putative ABC transport system ATP-binding protein
MDDPARAVLRIENLVKRYRPDRPPVLDGPSLELHEGEYVAIMGESGVGKSTLLNLLAGLDQPDSGRIVFDDVDVGTLDDDAATLLRRRQMGFVFQAFHVLPWLSVAQNVALPLDLLAIEPRERDARVAAMLQAVGLGALGARAPRELSGGELQRVAIARALVHRPRLLLADEPTGNLDPRTAAQVLALLREQVRGNAGAGILITHSLAAAETADRILVLDGHRLAPLARPAEAATDAAR